MFVRNELGALGACAVPATVSLRQLVVTDADRAAIGTALALGRAATLAEVRATITGAIARAVTLIGVAERQLMQPRPAGVRGQKMRDDFFDTFGTTPEFVPRWRPAGATWDRGSVVRERLRCAAKILAEGDIEFVAWGASCPHRTVWPDTLWASVMAGRYRICIGPRFWRAAREKDVDGMATTFLHEALHIYFDTIRHRLERGPYNMAACYERYVLVANALRVPDDVSGPCPPKRPVGDFPVPRRDAPRFAGVGAPEDRFDWPAPRLPIIWPRPGGSTPSPEPPPLSAATWSALEECMNRVLRKARVNDKRRQRIIDAARGASS